MKKVWFICICLMLSTLAQAGFGVAAGIYSPNTGLEDNDNGVLLGLNFEAKLALFGLKLEGFYIDSSGRYASELGEEFGEANIDIEAILAADFMFYPVGTTFFLQAGVNYISMNAKELTDFDYDVVKNELGLEGGLGVKLFDKLMVQGKIMYTPDAIESDVADTLADLDEDLMGYMVSVSWQF